MTKPVKSKRAMPKQERSQATYELLLKVAGELLGEAGADRISTNMICARAGVTPPALYRYFKDKDAVLEALGRRLMDRQNAALEQWIARYEGRGVVTMRENLAELLAATEAVTTSEPGAIWILRALRASPRLSHIRLESHRYVADKLTDAYIREGSKIERSELWRRLRLTVEMGFAVDEMLQEEEGLGKEQVFRQAAQLLGYAPSA